MHSSLGRRRVGGTTAVVLVLMALSTAGVSAAVPAVPKQPYYADNVNVTYFVSPMLPTAQSTAAVGALNYLGTSSDFYVTSVPLDTITDVYAAPSYPTVAPYNSYFAWTTCINANSATICNAFRIDVNQNKPHSYYRSLFCHELGHTIGFGHPGGKNSDATTAEKTCMRSSPDVQVYAAADISWININY